MAIVQQLLWRCFSACFSDSGDGFDDDDDDDDGGGGGGGDDVGDDEKS